MTYGKGVVAGATAPSNHLPAKWPAAFAYIKDRQVRQTIKIFCQTFAYI